ncbi:MAG TPA: glycosyltransferase family 2 protein [Gemmataceae bacterium]|jgi:glycosyltransferase involved in cell wall biosynthesis|nr:glycosyltransferase family 2 protein [Gemmataceae bacterium]
MRIGIELRHEGPAGEVARALRALFALGTEHTFVAFVTPFNRRLLRGAPFNVEVITLPLYGYFAAVDRLCAERAVDVLLRGSLSPRAVTFPPARQVFLGPRGGRSVCELLAACQSAARAPDAAPARPRSDDQPLVSVVTPSYNQGRFLGRTIDSVLAQTYPHVEYLVMDGGSTDETLDVLKSYGERVRWVSERDRGQAHAINKGFARTRGSVRAYLNSDDVLLPHAVGRAVEHFRRHPEHDLVYGQADIIDEEDRVTGQWPTEDYSFERLMATCFVCQPAAFWRTRVAERVGPFNEGLHNALDYEYWLRIDRAGGAVGHVHEVLARARMYAETKTLSAPLRMYRESIDVCRRVGGYADMAPFVGLWWFRLCEGRTDRPLGQLPPHAHLLAYLHHKWSNPLRRSLPAVWADLKRLVRHRLLRLRPARSRTVGYAADNWLEPDCLVQYDRPRPGERLYLAGVPARDTTLDVLVRGRPAGRRSLRGGAYQRIDLDVPGDAHHIFLRFSDFAVTPNRRKLAFHLQDTNLFSEQDARG